MNRSRSCRLCGSQALTSFLDLGAMPLANAYPAMGQAVTEERRYPLHVELCEACLLLQLESTVPPDTLFSEYPYFSSYSTSWVDHARRFADEAVARLNLGRDSLVVEVASNDGYLLRHFKDAGIRVLGIEPARNVAAVAVSAGVPTEGEFFGLPAARDLARRGFAADLLVANNVVAHVPDLHDFMEGVAVLLKEDGTFTLEVPHVLRLLEGIEFDTIYHEHVYYFSLLALERLLADHKLVAVDVQELPTHGGSLRVWARPVGGAWLPSEGVERVRNQEAQAGLAAATAYGGFADRVEGCRTALLDFLRQARENAQTVAAYGAAAKGNTLLNYCGVTRDDIAYVVDRSPHKQGRMLPGSHLPILHPDHVFETKPDFLLILPWNLRDEIIGAMAGIRAWGGAFVTAVPTLRVHR